MSDKVCLFCEKPSQAADWAVALGGSKGATRGTYKGQDYVIAASHGFLFELEDPADMVPASRHDQVADWSVDNLPWDDRWFDWKYKPRGKTRADMADSRRTANAMAAAARGCDEICIAGDLDPQGTGFEIEALNAIETGCVRPGVSFTRAKFGDQSPKSLQSAFETRSPVPDLERDPEWLRSITRERFDLLSMQWTRVLTRANPKGATLRTGRLKGVMVRLVGEQEDAVAAYVRKTVYQASFVDENGIRYTDDEQPRFERRGDVPLGGLHESAVTVDAKVARHTAPPRLLDLAGLSGRLAKSIGPKALLSMCEAMYMQRILSYPRTEDAKITHEQKAELMPLVPRICAVVGVDPALLTHTADRPTHIGVGMAHGANRPGTVVPRSLEALDAQFGRGAGLIYETLARSFLAMLAEDATYDAYKAHVSDFPSYTGHASVPTSQGWRAVFDAQDDAESDAKGPGSLAKPAVRSITNPKPATPTSKWLFSRLAKYDVGTGATRTSTLADVTATDVTYPLMTDRRGKLALTEYGRMEHELLHGCHIADLTLTATLYEQMRDVASGKTTTESVLSQVAPLVSDDIATIEANSRARGMWSEADPRERAEGTWNGRRVSIKRMWSTHRFTDAELADLFAGKTISFPMTSKRGDPYTATGSIRTYTYKGHKVTGFKLDDRDKSGSWSGPHTFPREFMGHKFDKEEEDALRAGRCILIEDLKGKYGRFSRGVSWSEDAGFTLYK